MTAGDGTGGRRGPVGFAVLTVMTALVFVALVSLGTWQVRRLAWKEALIERVETRLGAEPEALPPPASWGGLEAEAIEYRPVVFEATYDNAREIHVFIALTQPKGPLGGQGYFVLVPATLDDGRIVFVNRGFVPLEMKDASTRPEGRIDGKTTIRGLMRPAEERSFLSPPDNVAKNVWFVRDPTAMALAVGLDPSRVAPFTVDVRAGETPGGIPQGGETLVSFTNNHLGYAITWYGLAGALVVIYAAVVRRRWTSG